ncbi:hypothetical protein [Dinghuibacter silviterrae]|uniref:Lipoprotein n=1 Tax=Dinghuibacter silviterrae TaxID=1539049 RepID=A0A4R8DRA8_9BACT|nr:hypothetical protein [Dinghuibacter silviterrae]TDX00722.1 hypothetical protein EDB95_1749 [Dinghuibacter silviterrae]
MKKIVFVTLMCAGLGACQTAGDNGNQGSDTTVPQKTGVAADSARISSDSMINASPDTLKAN